DACFLEDVGSSEGLSFFYPSEGPEGPEGPAFTGARTARRRKAEVGSRSSSSHVKGRLGRIP
ncbi:unnamed protein product, partial [Cladocopium goreaui]